MHVKIARAFSGKHALPFR